MRKEILTSKLARICLLGAAYAATARLGLSLQPVSGFATFVWPPTGISLAALVCGGYGLWPGVFLGALIANLLNGASWPLAAGIAFGNSGEALLGALLLRKAGHFHRRLERVRDVTALILLAASLSTCFSAIVGVSSLWLAGLRPAVGDTLLAWWVGDALGDLVVAPLLLLLWPFRPLLLIPRPRQAEALALILLLAAACAFVFADPSTTIASRFPVPFMAFPFMIWAAIRIGPSGTAATGFTVSLIAIWGTARGLGPFGQGALASNLLLLDTYIGTLTVTGLLLAAAVAEQRRAQARAESLARRLENALQTRDEFLSIASHELKTPITALRLQLLLGRRFTPPEATKALRAIDFSNRQVERLSALIEDLLDVSRIRAGKFSFSLETMNLAETLRDAASALAEELRKAGCELTISAPPEVMGRWDRSRIEQLAANLLSNAVKYAPGSPITITVTHDGAKAVVSVEDQGPGIASDKQALIFERFERATAARGVAGLGLGLFIVRRIVEGHRGSIRVESRLGHGARFVIELPRDLAS